MSSLYGWHIERTDYHDWLKACVARGIAAGCPWVKIINAWAGADLPFGPDAKYLGRLWFPPDEPDKRLVTLGAAGADEWFRWAKPLMDRTPWIRIWEGPNEPAVQTIEQCVALRSFEAHRVELMHDAGLETASLCISTGCPEPEMWPYLGPALARTNYLAIHEYGMGRMELDGWHLLRYRKGIARLRDAGYRVPPILVTETGIDLDARPDVDGWLGQGISDAEYMAQLAGYDHAARLDPEVEALFPFTVNPNRWTSFDIHRQMAERIAEYMEAQSTTDAVIPEPASVEARILADALPTAWPWNKDHAFPRYVAGRGWQLRGREYTVAIDGVDHRYQVFATGEGKLRVVYAVVDQWHDVKHIEAGS